MEAARPPGFDLVVATVGRTTELGALLESLQGQSWSAFRVVVVDQNDDDRLDSVLGRFDTLTVERLRSPRGLSRARNAALAALTAELVGFPDDDCVFPVGLLELVAGRFTETPGLDGVTGRTAAADGSSAQQWGVSRRVLDRGTVWHGGSSASTFLRRSLVERTGAFDEALGLGAGTPWSSGEDTDYLVRALALGARIEYDPNVVVVHRPRARADLSAAGRREGAAVGYILGKHRYPARTVARMLTRPVGGTVVSLLNGDVARARFHAETLLGRMRGYVAGRSVSSAKSTA